MFHVGDKVIIKYRPPLYMKGYIDYALPVGVIVSDFGNGVYSVALNSGDEYVFDGEQLDVVTRASEMNEAFKGNARD